MNGNIYKITCEEAISFVVDACWGFAKLDEHGVFEWVNPAYCEILNAPAQLIIGTHWKDWTHEADIAEDDRLAKEVAQGNIPGYPFAKRYIQRGSTPNNQRVIWGLLSVVGKWEGSTFQGYLVQYQPYNNFHRKVDWSRVLYYVKNNWKIILGFLAVLLSWMGLNSEVLLQLLQKAEEVQDSARSVLP